MKRLLLLCGALLIFGAPAAFAAAGLNFTWSPTNACQSPQITNQTFACDANDASFTMVGSFMPGVQATQFYGIEVIVDGQSDGANVPSWWQAFNDGSCRQNSVSPGAAFLAGGGCTKLWSAGASGGLGAWQTTDYPPPTGNVPAANRLRFKIAYVMATARVNLNVSKEYSAFQLIMDSNNSINDPAADPPIVACPGCLVPVTLLLQQINVLDEAGAGSFEAITTELTNRCITWQSSTVACAVVPTRNRTWGEIKSLYR